MVVEEITKGKSMHYVKLNASSNKCDMAFQNMENISVFKWGSNASIPPDNNAFHARVRISEVQNDQDNQGATKKSYEEEMKVVTIFETLEVCWIIVVERNLFS